MKKECSTLKLKEMKKPQNGLVNPFSEKFMETWGLWKDFRKEEHNFQYRGLISEQMALKRLVAVSEGDEEKAVRIVEQSISRGWMDFYELKQPNPNGKSTRKAKSAGGDQTTSYFEQARSVFMQRDRNG